MRSLVVPVDFSKPSDVAVERATALARLYGASVHLVHAITLPLLVAPYEVSVPAAIGEGVRRSANERLEVLRNQVEVGGVGKVSGQIVETNDPIAAIREAVQDHAADLIVMGTHGRTGARHLLHGSVAAHVLRHADCPVLTVKSPISAEVLPAVGEG